MPLTIAAIVCAYNESRFLTGALARIVPGVRVLPERTKGLVTAREAARRAAQADVLAYLDADCRAPI